MIKMKSSGGIPESVYGILRQDKCDEGQSEIAEEIRRLGYAVLDPGFSSHEIESIARQFDLIHQSYVEHYGADRLTNLDEINTVRVPFAQSGGERFLELATTPILLELISSLIDGKFILNQQNGIINPPKQRYNQGSWHRDLPYQHFVSSSPLAINALYCVDDFTVENGATFVLPSSHKVSAFPSFHFVQSNAVQVEAKAGQFIVLDCMMFHSGGSNRTDKPRRAINHVYTIPFFKQQIRLPGLVSVESLTEQAKDILGHSYKEPLSVEEYLLERAARAKK